MSNKSKRPRRQAGKAKRPGVGRTKPRRGAEEWKRPRKQRVRAIRDHLREMYGEPVNTPHGHPIAELIKTVLSQHTSDGNRDRAFARLRERFPTWEEVR